MVADVGRVGHLFGVIHHGDDGGRVFHEAAGAVGHFFADASVHYLVVHEDVLVAPVLDNAVFALGDARAVARGFPSALSALHGDASAHYLCARFIGAAHEGFEEVGVHPVVGVEREYPFTTVGHGSVYACAACLPPP